MAQRCDFLFEYENRARELDSALLVAAELQKRGYCVAFVNSWRVHTHPVWKRRTRVCVVSAAYDDGTILYFSNLARRFEKIVDLMWEQVYHNGMKTKKEVGELGGIYGAALHTRHICWGEASRENLRDVYGVDDDCLRVLGYIPMDFYRPALSALMLSRRELFTQYRLDPEKKTLLFVSTFAQVNMPESEIKLDGGWEKQRASYECSVASQNTIIGWIKTLLKKHPELQFVYRPHPAEADNSDLKNLEKECPGFTCIRELAIRHWIRNCDVVFNWVSTALIEMYASGKPTYILQPFPIAEEMIPPIFSGARAIEDYDAFERAALSETKESFPVEQDLLTRYYAVSETPAYVQVADWLEETYHDPSYSGPFLCAPELVSANLFQRVKYWRIYYKEHVMQLIRYSGVYHMICEGIGRIRAAFGKPEWEYLKHIRYYRNRAKTEYVKPKQLKAMLAQYRTCIESIPEKRQ